MNRRAFLLGATMVMLGSIVAILLRSYVEAAFLAYGAKRLPWLLVANATGFAAATLGYDRLSRFAQLDYVLLILLVIAAALSPTLLRAGVPPLVFVVVLAAGSQVAGLALWNRVCAAVAGRDARRYLPRAGAAVTAGGALAGLGGGALIPRIGIAAIPTIAAGVTIIVIAITIVQQRSLERDGAPGAGTQAAGPTQLPPVQQSLIRAMVVVAALEGVVATVIDLQFIASVKARWHGQDLAIALALFYGGTNALLFLLQSAAVPRLLVTRSLPFTAAIHPLLVILSYLGFAAAPGFLGIAGTRTTDQVLRFATSRTSQELSLSALPPAPRARWKVLLRGSIWPAGAATAALVLLLLPPQPHARLAATGIVVAIAWAIAARIAARRFQTALAAPLGIKETQVDDPRRIDLESLERWTHDAGSSDANAAALARAAIARARIDASDLADHLRHDEPAVRAALFDQLGRAPVHALRGELRTAIAIEDDDHALALGIKALAVAGDDAGITRGEARPGLSREVDDAVRSARIMLREPTALADELLPLLARDPGWVVAVLRARPGVLLDDVLDAKLREALASPATRAGAFTVIARVGPATSRALLADALEAGDADALAAFEGLDEVGATSLAAALAADGDARGDTRRRAAGFSSLARAVLARTLAGSPASAAVVAVLLRDRAPEVAYAALRTALALTRGGGKLPTADVEAAYDRALDAFIAHLDARDAVTADWSACARKELDIATRRCAARVLWASAVEAATAGRDPGPIAASARHLIGGTEAERKRALDVVQELQARPQLLAMIERWLAPPKVSNTPRSLDDYDPWLARLASGQLASIEAALIELRRPALFSTVSGPALGALAAGCERRVVRGELFRAGDAGDSMFVVVSGSLTAARAGESRAIATGEVLGELAVLTHAPRAATVTGDAEVLVIDRAAFVAASRRAPELVLGLASTLAGWLAPNRPDVL